VKKNLLLCFIILSGLTINSALGQVYSREWVNTYGNDSVAAVLQPVKMCFDNSGFIYVVSEKDSSNYSKTVSLTKYSPSGNIIWNRVYANSGGYDVRPKCIACDRNNNIFIGGSEVADYLVLKYDSSGNFLWKINYNAVGGYYDEIAAIATDTSGNVYVTGYGALSTAPDYNRDALTLKINSIGFLIWDKYYNYPLTTSTYDKGTFLKLNNVGEIIIGGEINGAYGVCKYDTSGNLMWTGSPTPFEIGDMSLDDSGNIYMVPYTISQDLILVKYNSSGIFQWNKSIHYGGRLNSVVVKDSFIYATGFRFRDTTQKQDVILLKYNLNGDTIWTRYFNSSSNLYDVGRKVLAANNGNIFVVGTTQISANDYDVLTLKYDTAGVFQWHQQDSAIQYVDSYADAISDSSGNIYTSVISNLYNQSRKISKIDSSGNLQWTDFTENFQNRYDGATKIIKDYQGNIITGGFSNSRTLSSDIVVIKYDATGNILWKKRIHDSSNRSINLSQMLSDTLGNIYLCGRIYLYLTGGVYQNIAFTSKINSTGAIDWFTINDSLSVASSLAFDGNGNIYEIGLVYLAPYRYKSALSKYDTFGNILWTKHITDSCAGFTQCILADARVNFYLSQTQVNSLSNSLDITLLKTDSSGAVLWRRDFNGPASYADVFNNLVLDANQNPILVGYSDDLDYDMIVLKYDSSGNYLWNFRYAGSGNGWDMAYDVAVDLHNNIYVTGSSDNSNSVPECTTLKLSPSGNLLWNKIYVSNGAFPLSKGYAICTDNGGRAIVVGESISNGSISNILVLVYDSAGNQIFIDSYNQGAGSLGDNIGRAVVSDQNGSFYLAGSVDSHQNMTDFATIKYSDITLDVKKNWDEKGSVHVYPNPVSNSFNVSYSSNSLSGATIQILSTLGMKLSEKKLILNKGNNNFILDASGLSPGVYFLKLITGEKNYSNKLIVE